jgi:signal peptidase I
MAARRLIGLPTLIAIPVAVAVAALVMLAFGSLVAIILIGGKHYTIPSSSMTPTLINGDWMLALPISDALPARGTVVVFRHPRRRGVDYVKRVIAFAGETVQVRQGVVYIDDVAAKMERIEDRVVPMLLDGTPPSMPRCKNAPVAEGGDCIQEQWRETLPDGTTQIVLNISGEIGIAPERAYASADDTPVFIVPEDHVFVLGDHRDNAVDSRFADTRMIPVENLRHSAWIMYASIDRTTVPRRFRWERIFRRIE